ncbi:unnamed protein product [Spirodela intermedia]|uniref:Uncharacterized protein n=1 Tax=Spirodela intermedia TaxID=51605 RepID=A0A7I8K5Z8_SPIIN|nr:unnamed protein product [Spirodela intermedia]
MRRYKSFSELEEEEVKGFVDLGFVFNKETISPRMMRVVPGLQRLGEVADGGEAAPAGEEMKRKMRRPYLAEAWVVNGPSSRPSPLLNLRTLPSSPTECADVKRNIRFWARSVASAVHQESS